MQKNMTDRTPGSYDDFVAYLGTVRTDEELFSRLTYWFAGQNRPEDVLSRSELVEGLTSGYFSPGSQPIHICCSGSLTVSEYFTFTEIPVSYSIVY